MIKIYILFLFLNSIYSEPNPKQLDWRSKGAILPVPQKSLCLGTSGVITALDALSAMVQIRTGKLIQLSRQQVYDCSNDWCPCGAHGNASQTYDMILNKQGIDSEESYPYTGLCTHVCHYTEEKKVWPFSQFEYQPDNSNQEQDLYDLIKKGPVAINVNAKLDVFQNYSGGILDDPKCIAGDHNHHLLLVGYGTENNVDFWIARNSWGTNWGEKGYIRLIRDKSMCGVGHGWTLPLE